MMSNFKEYSLFLYYRQGDDLRAYLDENKGDLAKSLSDFSNELRLNSDVCARLARALSGKDVVVHAEANHVSFEPCSKEAEEALDVMVREKVLNVYEIEEEEYGIDDDYDDGDDDDDGDEPES